MLKQVDEINFPNLEHYLSSRYTFSVGKMVCEYCNFIAKNQQALSAHYRGCLVKKNMNKDHDDNSIQSIVIQTNENISFNEKKIKKK